MLVLNSALFGPSDLQMLDHFSLHYIYVILLLAEPFACQIDIVLQEFELFFAHVAIFAFTDQLFLFKLLSLLFLLHFLFKFFFFIFMELVVKTVFFAGSFFLQHLIDHVLK